MFIMQEELQFTTAYLSTLGHVVAIVRTCHPKQSERCTSNQLFQSIPPSASVRSPMEPPSLVIMPILAPACRTPAFTKVCVMRSGAKAQISIILRSSAKLSSSNVSVVKYPATRSDNGKRQWRQLALLAPANGA